MHVASHKLVGDKVSFAPAIVAGGNIKPTLVVIHDTASRLTKGSVTAWFQSADCNVSAHLVVERDGSIVQMVAFNRAAWHAGKSDWKGTPNCNGFSIGIEVVNPGLCNKDGRAWYHKPTDKGFEGLKHVKTVEHGDGHWMDYTPEQIKAVTEICQALVKAYPEIQDVTGHYVISPRRKVDPNPLFPLEQVRQAAFGLATAATLEPVAAQPIRPVSAAATAYNSKSVWALLTGVGSWAASKFKEQIDWALDLGAWAMGILPSVVSEVKTSLTNSQLVFEWLRLSWVKASFYITVACLLIVLIRHVNDKRKLAAATASQ